MKKVLAVIPARGGSKGIPLKNMQPVHGKPLIDWTILAAQRSKHITKVVVSSDDEDILNHAKAFENVICVTRPSELAKDATPTEPVISHVLETLSNESYDTIVLLQPTSPLRTAQDIDDAFEVLENSEATALISVIEPKHHPLKSFKSNSSGFLEGLVNNKYPFTPRQELPEVYQPNGAIYIFCYKDFLRSKKLMTNKTVPYIMSHKKSVDIDTLEDVEIVEKLLKDKVNE